MIKKPLRILVAEDNLMNLELVCYMLEELHYDYSIAEDGAIAVEKFKLEKFSLILMDCHMGGMDGFQATKAIRQLEAEASNGGHVPIIALTANAIMGDKNRCFEMGMDDYLSKPFKFKQLQDLLDKWLGADTQPVVSVAQEETVSEPANISDAKDVDLQLLGSIFDDPQIIEQIIQTYLEQAPKYMDDIRLAAENSDMDGLAFATHAFKSSSAALGISRVAQTCKDLEYFPVENGPLTVPILVSRLEAEFAAAVAILQNYLNPQST